MNKKDIGKLYEQYGPMVLARCRRILKDEDMALDVLHDVFEKFMSGFSRMPIITNKGAWFNKMATNRCIDVLRKEKKNEDDDESLKYLKAKESIEDAIVRKITIRELIKRLDRKNQVILQLHYVLKHKQHEVARILEISERAVRSRIKMIKKIAGKMKEEI